MRRKLKPRLREWNGVKGGARIGMSGVTGGANIDMNGVTSGARANRRQQKQRPPERLRREQRLLNSSPAARSEGQQKGREP